MKNPKIFVIILNWNGKEDTLACLNSLSAVSSPEFDTIVIDNGSKDDSVPAIKEQFPHVILIETHENLGFSGGNNVGIRHALSHNADYIFLLNNDTVVDPHILRGFLKTMQQIPEASILGGRPYLFDTPSQLDYLGGVWDEKKGIFDLISYHIYDEKNEKKKPIPVDYVTGCALFAKAEVFKKIGLLEPKYFLYWEESDWCMRAKKQGFGIYTCPDAILWHKVSASLTGGKPHATYFWWRNRLLWIERNCAFKQKTRLTFLTLIPEGTRLYKHYFLKHLQLLGLKIIRSHPPRKEKKRKIRLYKAAIWGIRDYLFRRFGNAPSRL